MKKAILLVLAVVMLCCLLSGCASKVEQPNDTAQKLVEAGYQVQVLYNSSEINKFTEDYYINTKGVYCIILGQKLDDEGNTVDECMLAYCDEYSHPNEVEETMINAVKSQYGEETDMMVKKVGFTIFAGKQATLDMLEE